MRKAEALVSQKNRLYEFYSSIINASPEVASWDFPAGVGTGSVFQAKTKQGVVFSDWKMKYCDDQDISSLSDTSFLHIMFNFGADVSWEFEDSHRYICLEKSESCMYLPTQKSERILYLKNRDYLFKSVRIPKNYLEKLASDFFDSKETYYIEKNLFAEVSQVKTTAHMEKILIEAMDYTHYKGGFGFLYLESKTLEFISIYLSEIFGFTDAGFDGKLSKTDRESIVEIKRLIDSDFLRAFDCETLARRAGMSLTKFMRGFTSMYGMPVHTYIINKRLEKAASLLVERTWNVGEVASMVGYSNASHFAAAFKRKFGMNPKRYMGS